MLKKIFASVTAVAVLFSSAFALPQATLGVVDKVADKVVVMMEEGRFSHIDFSDMIAMYQNSLEGEDMKVEILDALLISVMDKYFEVDNFLDCVDYYDGCNHCEVGVDLSLACTKMYCEEYSAAHCTRYSDEEEFIPALNIDQLAIVCEDK